MTHQYEAIEYVVIVRGSHTLGCGETREAAIADAEAWHRAIGSEYDFEAIIRDQPGAAVVECVHRLDEPAVFDEYMSRIDYTHRAERYARIAGLHWVKISKPA